MNSTKTMICLALSALIALFCSGCILVPYSYETVSQEVIGARADSNGKVYEQIIRYDKKLNFFVLGFSPDAKFVGHFGYSRYAAVAEDSENNNNESNTTQESGNNQTGGNIINKASTGYRKAMAELQNQKKEIRGYMSDYKEEKRRLK